MKHKWTIIISIITLAIIVFFIFGRGGDDVQIVGSDPTMIENNLFNIDFDEQPATTVASADPDAKIAKVGEGGGAQGSARGFEAEPQNRLHYTNSQYNFSFDYPVGVTVGSFKEGEGDMVLIQSEDTSKSAQIFIIPFDEPAPISKARILKDLPDMVIKDEQKGAVGGHPAIAFLGEHETLGDTYEIWFTRDGNLYQIMTKASTAQFLTDILKTWTE